MDGSIPSYIIEPGSTPEQIARQRRIAEALMKTGNDFSPVGHWTVGAARMANTLAGVLADRRASQDENAGRASAAKDFESVFGGSSPLASNSNSGLAEALAEPQRSVPAFAGQGMSPTYMGNMAAKEGGPVNERATAVNPKSGATGVFQFLPSTWNGLAKSMPELGLTADGMKDPKQQQVAMQAFTGQNAKALSAGGIPVNDSTLALAHQQGAGGAKALLGNPGLNVVDALAPAYKGDRRIAMQAVVNNGGDPNMTAGQFAQKVQGYYGGKVSGSQGQATLTGGDNLGQGGDTTVAIMRALQNPWLSDGQRDVLKLEYARRVKDTSPQWEKLNDGTLYDKRTGRTMAASGGAAYRDLTDPADRARHGIPATDTTPYQIDPAGKLLAVGRGGVTVNNGPGTSKQVYDTVEARAGEARAAAQAMPAFSEAKRLVDS